MDGVFADMESALVRHAEGLFGAAVDDSPRSDDPPSESGEAQAEATPSLARLNLTSRQEQRLWRHVATIENFWESLDEIEPGTVARLAQVALDREWEVIFLTKRPRTDGATAQVQSQRWLEARGFPMPSVFVVQGSRGLIAAALDLHVVIDDRPENCLDVAVESKARAILVRREHTRELPPAAQRLGIQVVASVTACLDTLTKVDSRDASGPSILRRG